MKKLNVLLLLFLIILFSAKCNQNNNNDEEFVDDEVENVDFEDEQVGTDFDELENKMEEIMYEKDTSGAENKKDVVLIKPQGAKKVSVDLKIGAGSLKLSGGANELLTGGFIYTDEKWKPRIKYIVKDNKGFLEIKIKV